MLKHYVTKSNLWKKQFILYGSRIHHGWEAWQEAAISKHGGRKLRVFIFIFKCKSKVEKTNRKQGKAVNLGAGSQWQTSSSKAPPPEPLQTAPPTGNQVSQIPEPREGISHSNHHKHPNNNLVILTTPCPPTGRATKCGTIYSGVLLNYKNKWNADW